LYNNLKERFNNPFFDVYPAFINDYTESCSTNCNVLNKDAIANFYIDLHKNHQIELNYYPILRNSGCGATRLNYFIIGPKGELYKCWNDLGNKSRIVGSISDDKILNENILFNYLVGPTMFEDEKCKSCEIFPICWGGCQWTRIENSISNRHFDLCTMRKNNMDKLLELHYEMKLKKNLQKA